MKVKVLIKKAKLVSLNLMKKRKSLRYHKAINLNQKWKRAKKKKHKKHKTLKINRVQNLRKKMNCQSKSKSKTKKNMIRKMMNLIHLKTKEMKEGKMLRIIRS